MRASRVTGAVFEPLKPVGRSTAYYIFDSRERHLYELDFAHFRAKNHMLSSPVIVSGPEDMDRLVTSMVPTSGTIMQIVDQFILGGTIAFPDKNTAAKIYRRIQDHLSAHLKAMQSDVSYEAPDDEAFKQMAEFAVSIRYIAVQADPELDKNIVRNTMETVMPARPRFNMEQNVKKEEPQAPKPARTMDSIEKYLESINGN